MKKAKIMLTAVGILAVVGGALAFKARDPHTFYKLNTANVQRGCTIPVSLSYQTTDAGGFLLTGYSTSPNSNITHCTVRVIDVD